MIIPYSTSNKSLMSTWRRRAISTNCAIEGCILLVFQRDTVISVTPILSASQRLVSCLSASTTRILVAAIISCHVWPFAILRVQSYTFFVNIKNSSPHFFSFYAFFVSQNSRFWCNAIICLLPEIVEDATPIFTAKLCAVTRLNEEINM